MLKRVAVCALSALLGGRSGFVSWGTKRLPPCPCQVLQAPADTWWQICALFACVASYETIAQRHVGSASCLGFMFLSLPAVQALDTYLPCDFVSAILPREACQLQP